MLLVIDDAWTIEDISPFLIGGKQCTHLITTRFPIIAAQTSINHTIALQELDTEHAFLLLKQLAPQITEIEQQYTHTLIQAIDGLPLALTLTGNYLRLQGYSGQVRRILAAFEYLSDTKQRFSLSGLTNDFPGASTSLRSTFTPFLQHLPTNAKKALIALASLPPKPNSFSEEEASNLINGELELLDLLTDTGLVESRQPGFYSLHRVVTDYAHTCLSEDVLRMYP